MSRKRKLVSENLNSYSSKYNYYNDNNINFVKKNKNDNDAIILL